MPLPAPPVGRPGDSDVTGEPIPEGWWRNFFVDGHLDYHRARWRSVGDAPSAVERIIAVAALSPGSAVLDVPCGSGRHALELAARGFRVVGIDSCREFVDEARLAAPQAGGGRARFDCRDMRDLPFDACFDAVVCLGGSFGYFGDAGDAAFLSACARSLRPGGWLFIDTATLETVLRVHEPTACERFGELTARHRRLLDPERGTVHLELTVASGATEATRSYHQRLYRYDELCRFMGQAGCRVVHSFGAHGEPFGPGSSRLLIVGRRSDRTDGTLPA